MWVECFYPSSKDIDSTEYFLGVDTADILDTEYLLGLQ